MTNTPRWAVACAVIYSAAGCATLPPNVSVGRIENPGNTQVPLPPGNWVKLASEITNTGSLLGGGIDNSHSASAYYAKIESGKIKQIVFVRSSEGAPHPYGYGAGPDCLRSDPNDFRYLQDIRSATPNSVDCLQVVGNRAFNPPTQSSSSVYRTAFDAAKQFGGFPRIAVMVEFAEARSQRFQVYYLFDFPDSSGAPYRANEWRLDAITPPHRLYVDQLAGWAKGFREAVRLGTEYRL